MKKHNIVFLITIISAFPQVTFAKDQGLKNPVHKFWSCAITTYNTLVDGNYQENKCRANTQYSEPPCREFFVEYEGAEGIRPGVSFKQTIVHNMKKSSSRYDELNIPTKSTTTTIEIKKDKNQYLYTHTIVATDIKFSNKWFYNGKCSYYEAPVNEKIYMDSGLKTSR